MPCLWACPSCSCFCCIVIEAPCCHVSGLQPSLSLVAENGYWIRASGKGEEAAAGPPPPSSSPTTATSASAATDSLAAGAGPGPGHSPQQQQQQPHLGGWEPAVSHADFSWKKIALPILKQYQVSARPFFHLYCERCTSGQYHIHPAPAPGASACSHPPMLTGVGGCSRVSTGEHGWQ